MESEKYPNDSQQLVEKSMNVGTNSRGKITVCVRLRPTIPEDLRQANALRNAPEICVHLKSDGQTVKLIQDRFHSRLFKADHTFGVNASQTEVYNIGMRPIVYDVLKGFNGTGLVYGQTSSGKTYTMFGSENKLGIAHFAISDIFDRIQQYEENNLIGKVFMSFYHIYVEQIYDLLGESPTNPRQPLIALNIREDNVRGVHVENLSTYHVKDKATAHALIAEGMLKRKVHSSTQNIKSSRSHAILQILVDLEETHLFPSNQQPIRTPSGDSDGSDSIPEQKFIVRRRKLTLVDLAGSERVSSHRQTTKQQLKEAAIINKSIAALGNCISALCHHSDLRHVPFRDTKLTRLLAESLGGYSRTCIIANLSPCAYHYEETYSTLKFATRAKLVPNKVGKAYEGAPLDTQLLTYVQKMKSVPLNPSKSGSIPHSSPAEPYLFNENNHNNGFTPPNNYNTADLPPHYYQNMYRADINHQPLLPASLHHYQQQQHPTSSFPPHPQQPYPTGHFATRDEKGIPAITNDGEALDSQDSIGNDTQQYAYDPSKPPLLYKKLLNLGSTNATTTTGGTASGGSTANNSMGLIHTEGGGTFSLHEFLKACTTNNYQRHYSPEGAGGVHKSMSYHDGDGDHESQETSDIDDSTIQDDYYESSEYHPRNTAPRSPSGELLPLSPSKESLGPYPTQRVTSQEFLQISRSSSFQEHLLQENRQLKTKNGVNVQDLNLVLTEEGEGEGERDPTMEGFSHEDMQKLPSESDDKGEEGLISRFLSASDDFTPSPKAFLPPSAVTMDAFIHTSNKMIGSPSSPSPRNRLPPLPTATSTSNLVSSSTSPRGTPTASGGAAVTGGNSILSRHSSGFFNYSNTSATSNNNPFDQQHPAMVHTGTGEGRGPPRQVMMVDKGIQSNRLFHNRSNHRYDGSLNDFAGFTTYTAEVDTEMDYDLLIQMNNPNVSLAYYTEEELSMMKQSLQNPLLLFQQVMDLKKQLIEKEEEIEGLKKFILDQA